MDMEDVLPPLTGVIVQRGLIHTDLDKVHPVKQQEVVKTGARKNKSRQGPVLREDILIDTRVRLKKPKEGKIDEKSTLEERVSKIVARVLKEMAPESKGEKEGGAPGGGSRCLNQPSKLGWLADTVDQLATQRYLGGVPPGWEWRLKSRPIGRLPLSQPQRRGVRGAEGAMVEDEPRLASPLPPSPQGKDSSLCLDSRHQQQLRKLLGPEASPFAAPPGEVLAGRSPA
ncbi:hypothetical protein EAI_02129 [Harpegnathos saltator]|uniref:Uncharacterized protein n=1 Tax=Harpegnathos saltator TaxID=610380 RepID=E2BAC9_HARSA|nr:hypothetical protein EAI_02129 [Harpegnathos saltator]